MASKKRDHRVLLEKLNAASRGEKVEPPNVFTTVNKKLMSAAIALLVDWTPENRKRFLGFIEPMAEIGHMTIGEATEAGAPGMHGSYSLGAILAVYREADYRIHQGSSDRVSGAATTLALYAACERVLLAEAGLNRHFRWPHRFRPRPSPVPVVVLPCPRAKDEDKRGNPMPPFDGYRDVVTALLLGEDVRKPAKYYKDDMAIAVRLMKDLVVRGIWDSRLQAEARDAPMPKLRVPIQRREIPDGWIAWFEDNPHNRQALIDPLTWVRCSRANGITWGYDFAEVPGV